MDIGFYGWEGTCAGSPFFEQHGMIPGKKLVKVRDLPSRCKGYSCMLDPAVGVEEKGTRGPQVRLPCKGIEQRRQPSGGE